MVRQINRLLLEVNMAKSLFLTDIIEKTGLPKNEVAAVRHSLNHDNARLAWGGIAWLKNLQ